MKHFFCILILCVSNALFGQKQYETFVVNLKVGVVELNTLSETMTPKAYKRVIFFTDDYFTHEENDSLKIFSKITGTWKSPIPIKKYSPVIILNDHKFLIRKVDTQLALMDTLFQTVYRFPKNYERPVWFYGERYSFFGMRNNETIDIFKFNEKSKKIAFYKTITTLDHTYATIGKNKKVIVFFGG